MNKVSIPKIEDIESFLTEFGWHFRKTTTNNNEVVIFTNFSVNEEKGILISFRIVGEFVMASTMDLLQNIPKAHTEKLFRLNDTLKLVKLFPINPISDENLNVDLGFELWADSWNKGTFFAFMDMLCAGINAAFDFVKTENIPHNTNFVVYDKK